MKSPTLFCSRLVGPDTHVLPAYLPAPNMGLLAVNAFLIDSAQPTLIDAGLPALAGEFMAELGRLIDPIKLRWIILTHNDPDHMGALWSLLESAPHARLVTSFLGLGKLDMLGPIDTQRVFLVNPGQQLWVGDRHLRVLKPPVYDAPETFALFDELTGSLFSSDSFGAVVSQPYEDARTIVQPELRRGMQLWGTVDAPWIHGIPERAFLETLDKWVELAPARVLSSHLAPWEGDPSRLFEIMRGLPMTPPFVGPDQEALLNLMSA